MKYLIILLFCNIDAIYGRINETNLTMICDNLKLLDRNLTELVSEMPPGLGSMFLECLEQFNENLKHFIVVANMDAQKSFRTANSVLPKGWPEFIHLSLDDNKMKSNFNWTDTIVKQVHQTRQTSYICWNAIWCLENELIDKVQPANNCSCRL